ncbi:MAG TPA: hypothetical protein VNG93_06285 [Candidatus Dormibacteraeota bacterium]|nr:hypothetical protein [Candidatus Dormibacteraeota bacterium]
MRRLATTLGAMLLVVACGSAPPSPTSGSGPSGSASPIVSTPSPTEQPSPSPTPTATPIATPSPNPSPIATPTQGPTLPADFACADASGGMVAVSTVSDVRVGQHEGYDRFVIEFGGGVPDYTVVRQNSATFQSGGGKGDQYTLEGDAGVMVTIHSVSNWTSSSGPTEFTPEYPFLHQAKRIESYEGYQQWALGVHSMPCLRVFTLDSPSRLVVDIAAG